MSTLQVSPVETAQCSQMVELMSIDGDWYSNLLTVSVKLSMLPTA